MEIDDQTRKTDGAPHAEKIADQIASLRRGLGKLEQSLREDTGGSRPRAVARWTARAIEGYPKIAAAFAFAIGYAGAYWLHRRVRS